ncbi:unnamed protein product [Rhizophagus irregularis]|nr:unnamed protein product [Rhizophagus irregularis]
MQFSTKAPIQIKNLIFNPLFPVFKRLMIKEMISDRKNNIITRRRNKRFLLAQCNSNNSPRRRQRLPQNSQEEFISCIMDGSSFLLNYPSSSIMRTLNW